MAVPQITIRLPTATKVEFEKYANSLSLKTSELAKLLILREYKRRRLAALHRAGQAPTRLRRSGGASERLPTVTAHLSSLADKTAFEEYARQCGLNPDNAGAWILEMELQERWLENVLSAA